LFEKNLAHALGLKVVGSLKI